MSDCGGYQSRLWKLSRVEQRNEIFARALWQWWWKSRGTRP